MSNDPQLALNARPENVPTPPSVPEPTPSSLPEPTPPSVPDRPTFAPRPRQTADCPPTLRTGHDDEIARLRTDFDDAVAVSEGARTEKRPWHMVRRQHRR